MKKLLFIALISGVTLSYAQTSNQVSSNQGPSFGDVVEEDPLSSDQPIEASFSWKVFPNPVLETSFTLGWVDNTPKQSPTLRIYNTVGQVVVSETFIPLPSGNTFELGNLPSGIYIVELELDNYRKTEKLQVL